MHLFVKNQYKYFKLSELFIICLHSVHDFFLNFR